MRGKAQKVKQADLTRLGAGPPSEDGGPHLSLFPTILVQVSIAAQRRCGDERNLTRGAGTRVATRTSFQSRSTSMIAFANG
jgi:hypothetical protein